ncbi:MAG: Nucleoside triphosphate pyrophosphatase [Chroococcopsis gigantea SAG 12.99]|jgi:septum formation protein|nr:septum formation inhibitor Maf [Chlorogloea purpurea SAG 13.99]MDV2998596.1 Nucleoside triphosphate pyrophosphatase [Chroococcopsis gigantea SAG 12.99]
MPPFVLASVSPARRRLLQTVGIEPIVQPSHFDESLVNAESSDALVKILAQCKAETVAQEMKGSLILGCDSVLDVDGEIYGKPASKEEAIERWQIMRGHYGTLYTGHALIDQTRDKLLVYCGVTKVYFANPSDAEIKAYVDTEEPLKCAGCFALEGKGGVFVEKLEGCHSNVIGLSLPLLRQMLKQLNYEITDFWEK